LTRQVWKLLTAQEFYVGRGFSKNTYIRRLLDEDAALPAGAQDKLTNAQRIELIGQLPKSRKGNNLPKLRKKAVRTERSLSPEAEARIKAIGASKPIAPVKTETSFADALKALESDENQPEN
jgi:hypothetical protein